eukprot:m.11795 g.11795  ORF g.11795 m.11795 type:complete len:235 (-) comp16339_c0_seq2:47-751(-)
MAFSSKYGTGASSTTTSSADDLSQSDETSAALRAAGFKILRFGAAPQIFLYVGQSNSSNQPHGHGYLYFPNGDIQECEYKAGRAHGNGTLVTVSGSEMKGKWTENKRVGDFALIDAKGEHWIENYAADGKKISKTKVKTTIPNPAYTEGADETVTPKTIDQFPPADVPARGCWNCNAKCRERNNHAWACRTHKGNWAEDYAYRGEGARPGVWSCCGREQKDEVGCTFAAHNFRS